MSSVATGRVWADGRLRGTPQHVVLCLADHCARGTVACYPSKPTIARETGYAPSTIHEAIAEAVRLGCVHEIDWREVPEGVERQLGKRGRSNLTLVLCGLTPQQIEDAKLSFGLSDYTIGGGPERSDPPTDRPIDRPIDRPTVGYKPEEPVEPEEPRRQRSSSLSESESDHPKIGGSALATVEGLRRRLDAGESLEVVYRGERWRPLVPSQGGGVVLRHLVAGTERRIVRDDQLAGVELVTV